MPAAARRGDLISHGGEIIEGSPDHATNSIPTARKDDAVICVIHGLQKIAAGSPTVEVNGRQRARVGDPITCGAVITTGSPNVDVGG